MAGVFGSGRSAAYAATGLEKPGLGKQILNQLGMNLLGVDFEGQRLADAYANQRQNFTDALTQMALGKPASVEQARIGNNDGQDITAAFAPQYDLSPARAPINVNDPLLPALALRAKQLGVDMSTMLDVMKAQQPNYSPTPSNEMMDTKTGRLLPGGAFPKVGEGMVTQRGANGELTGIVNAPNYVKSAAETAGAVAGAQEGAKAGYDLVDYDLGGGRTIKLPRAYVGALNMKLMRGGAGQPGAGGAGGDNGVAPGITPSPQDAEYAKGVAANAVKTYQGLQDAGASAQNRITGLKRMSSLLEGLDTGRLTPAMLAANSVGSSLGIKIDPKWGNIEAANAIANKLVLDNMGGSLGAGFSNADRDFAGSIGPQATQTPQGRKQIITFAIAKAQREQEIARMARQWQQRYGRIDKADGTGKTFQDYLEIYGERNPLVPAK